MHQPSTTLRVCSRRCVSPASRFLSEGAAEDTGGSEGTLFGRHSRRFFAAANLQWNSVVFYGQFTCQVSDQRRFDLCSKAKTPRRAVNRGSVASGVAHPFEVQILSLRTNVAQLCHHRH